MSILQALVIYFRVIVGQVVEHYEITVVEVLNFFAGIENIVLSYMMFVMGKRVVRMAQMKRPNFAQVIKRYGWYVWNGWFYIAQLKIIYFSCSQFIDCAGVKGQRKCPGEGDTACIRDYLFCNGYIDCGKHYGEESKNNENAIGTDDDPATCAGQ